MLAKNLVREAKAEDKDNRIKVEITEEDYAYIRDKLIPMIAQLEVKISQELALKKTNRKTGNNEP